MTNRATHPDTLVPSALAVGEDYASVSAILQCEDLPHATLHIPHWRHADGRMMAVRVRALSLTQRERIQRESTNRDGSIDVVAQLCATWREGCTAPTFTAEQAAALCDKNPQAIEQGANFIWLLSAIDQEWIDGIVQQQSGAPPAAEAEDADASSAADTGRKQRMRRVA